MSRWQVSLFTCLSFFEEEDREGQSPDLGGSSLSKEEPPTERGRGSKDLALIYSPRSFPWRKRSIAFFTRFGSHPRSPASPFSFKEYRRYGN